MRRGDDVTELSPQIAYTVAMTHENPLRASDRDREQTAERLRHAAGEGRLLPDELEQRLHAAFAARTYGELDTIVDDLPSPGTPRSRRTVSLTRPRALLAGLLALGALLLILMVAAAGLHRRTSFAAPTPAPGLARASPHH